MFSQHILMGPSPRVVTDIYYNGLNTTVLAGPEACLLFLPLERQVMQSLFRELLSNCKLVYLFRYLYSFLQWGSRAAFNIILPYVLSLKQQSCAVGDAVRL